MLKIGENSAGSSKAKDDDNGDNEHNLDILQDANYFMILNGGRLYDGCTT
jgi:hypothetical protein